MIDILIPTYNREQLLIQNLRLLDELIKEEGLGGNFRLLVSDNCSQDGTANALEDIRKEIDLEMTVFRQQENIGLERNVVFVLEHASSEIIMYLGDDDYLPKGYLSFVVDTIRNDKAASAIVSGVAGFYADGAVKPGRIKSFSTKKYSPGFISALALSHLGHQLSGLVFRREGLVKSYLEAERYRNLYPFIYFLGFNAMRGTSYYAPKYKVMVSQSNTKDWRYDDSGILSEIFRNFHILFPGDPFKRLLLCMRMMLKQGWRLRVGDSPLLALKAMRHLFSSKDVDPMVKLSLIPLYPFLYAKKPAYYLYRKIFLNQ